MGTSWIFQYDPSEANRHLFPSSLPGVFPDITDCSCKMEMWDLPVIGIHGFWTGLCKGVELGGIPGFPTLGTIEHRAGLGVHGVNLFNSESVNETQVVTLENRYDGKSVESVLMEWFGRAKDGKMCVYFGYPFLTEAVVVGLSDELFTYRIDTTYDGRGDVVKKPHSRDSSEKFQRASDVQETFYSKKYGILTGLVDILVEVLPFKGMRLMDDGGLVKEFGEESVYAPLCTIVEEVKNVDERFVERPARAIAEDFPVGSNVFLISTHPDNCGAYCEVAGYGEEGAVNIKFEVCEQVFNL
jgi:5'-3' exoribonuclease 1